MRNLNTSEKKVLTLLEQDGRLASTRIANKTRLSPEGVIKIIDRLKVNNIVSRFNTKINYSRIGYCLYPVHVKLAQQNTSVVAAIQNVIKKHHSCAWHTFCEGEYDLLLSFKILRKTDNQDMEFLLSELAPYTLEKDVSIVLSAFEFSKSFAGDRKNKKVFTTFNWTCESLTLSEKEFALLEALRMNSREKILTISKSLGLTPRSTIRTLRALENKQVISGFKTKLNMARLGYQPCLALISVGPCDEKEHMALRTYCQYTPGIHYYLRQVGKYDIELTFDVINVTEFYDIINSIREKFLFVKKITTLICR